MWWQKYNNTGCWNNVNTQQAQQEARQQAQAYQRKLSQSQTNVQQREQGT
jgi:hypothetical protein